MPGACEHFGQSRTSRMSCPFLFLFSLLCFFLSFVLLCFWSCFFVCFVLPFSLSCSFLFFLLLKFVFFLFLVPIISLYICLSLIRFLCLFFVFCCFAPDSKNWIKLTYVMISHHKHKKPLQNKTQNEKTNPNNSFKLTYVMIWEQNYITSWKSITKHIPKWKTSLKPLRV